MAAGRIGRILAVLLALSITLASARAEEALRVGDQRGNTRSLLKAAGELDAVPYRIEWSIFPVGAPLVEALNAGAIDFGYVGDATTTFGLAGGAAIKTINVWRMLGSSNAIVVPADAPYHGIADLRGKRIGLVRGSPGHILVAAALKQAGLPLSAVTIVYLSAADAKAALSSGSIDAWAIWDPYAATAELQDHMRRLLTGVTVIEEVECGIASDAAIAGKRALLLDFIGRVRRGYAWAEVHPAEHAQIFSAETGVPIDVANLTFSRMHVVVLPAITDEAIGIHQRVADLYAEAGIIPAPLDISKAYDRSFVLPP